VFRSDGTPVLRTDSTPFVIPPFSAGYGAFTAVGNIDGTGLGIIAGEGKGITSALPYAMGYSDDGSPMPGMPFSPYRYKYGITVGTGDFDGDGKDEIITGTVTASSEVKVLSYNGVIVSSTGVNFLAYLSSAATGKFNGVNVAAADLDGDGMAELITTPVSSSVIPEVRVFKVDTSGGAGNWTVGAMYNFPACGNVSGTQLTTGDINADGVPEILVVCLKTTRTSEVREYTATGGFIRSLNIGDMLLNYIAAGDTNMDGKAEIILGDGPSSNRNNVRIMDAETGSIIRTFRVFTNSFGVRVSVGDLGYIR
jgi:hypothetical protein